MKYKTNQVRNTDLKKKKTNNAYLKSQSHRPILENDRLPMRERERERERERDGKEKKQYKVIKSR